MMKKLAVALLVIAGLAATANAAVILQWSSFVGATPIVSQVADQADAGLDSGGIYNDLTRGAGAGTSTGNSSFRTTGFQNDGIDVSNTDYFQFILSASSGNLLSLTDVTVNSFVGTSTYYANPGVSHQWAYSLDGSSFTLIGAPVVQTTLASATFGMSGVGALQNVAAGTDVTLRYYATGQTSTGGWGYGSTGVTVNGSVTAIPEPGVLSLLSIGGLALLRVVRRRKT